MKSLQGQFEFERATGAELDALTSVRAGETRLGERIVAAGDPAEGRYKFVILGISEDIGPQSNGGFPGSVTAFGSFLKRFLNIQSNEFLSGENIAVLGEIVSLSSYTGPEQGRVAIEDLDDLVYEVLLPYVMQGVVPVVIGGGHNNAYPLIRALSTREGKPVRVINLDPHADFRPLEGRHSGNPFSYAYRDGYLGLYAVIGLHQSYNSQHILDELRSKGMLFSFFDDYISGKADFHQDLSDFAQKIQTDTFGIELDMDSIAYMPSSAFSPSGVTLEQARAYILKLGASEHAAYLHLPEAAPEGPEQEAVAGKALAYLVADFIKARS